jgi:hypothetical protein
MGRSNVPHFALVTVDGDTLGAVELALRGIPAVGRESAARSAARDPANASRSSTR